MVKFIAFDFVVLFSHKLDGGLGELPFLETTTTTVTCIFKLNNAFVFFILGGHFGRKLVTFIQGGIE